jgi:hypothetical protein
MSSTHDHGADLKNRATAATAVVREFRNEDRRGITTVRLRQWAHRLAAIIEDLVTGLEQS